MAFKLLTKCEACKEDRWFVMHRTYKEPHINKPIKSQSLQCGKCYRDIKKMIGE